MTARVRQPGTGLRLRLWLDSELQAALETEAQLTSQSAAERARAILRAYFGQQERIT